MALDQEAIATLLPDNTTGLISPASLRDSFAAVAEAYDGSVVTAFRAVLEGQGSGVDPIVTGDINIASVVATAASTYRITLTATSTKGVQLDFDTIDLAAKIRGTNYPLTEPPWFTWTPVSLGVIDLHIGKLNYGGSSIVQSSNLVAQIGDFVSVSGVVHII